jgi:hypothetical protein
MNEQNGLMITSNISSEINANFFRILRYVVQLVKCVNEKN